MRGRPEIVRSLVLELGGGWWWQTYNLVESLRSTETCWTRTDDEHVDRTARCQVE